jgi:nucleotide-binding universal stress UspA family protein
MKNEIKKILVPVDFTGITGDAIEAAASFAQSAKCEIMLMHVIEFNGYNMIPEIHSMLPPLNEIEAAVTNRMGELRDRVSEKWNLRPGIFITAGNVYSEILAFAKKAHIDLILMGAHGVSGYKEFFIGSNTQRVTSLSDVPVLSIQGRMPQKFNNILVPIDNSLYSREKLNEAIVIARIFSSTIHILGLPDSNEKAELDKFKVKLASVEDMVTAAGLSFKTAVVNEGTLANEALAYAGENQCDLIVINTGHESRVTGISPGAFAHEIVNHSKIPVLSIKHAEGNYEIEAPGYGVS